MSLISLPLLPDCVPVSYDIVYQFIHAFASSGRVVSISVTIIIPGVSFAVIFAVSPRHMYIQCSIFTLSKVRIELSEGLYCFLLLSIVTFYWLRNK